MLNIFKFLTLIFVLLFYRKNPELFGQLAKGQSPKVNHNIRSFLFIDFKFYIFFKK